MHANVHADVHADRMADDELAQKFPWFVDHWGGDPGFSCVIAHDGPEVAGFAYGAPANDGRQWWREQGAKTEAGKRTLPLPKPVLRALKAFRTTQAAEKLAELLG